MWHNFLKIIQIVLYISSFFLFRFWGRQSHSCLSFLYIGISLSCFITLGRASSTVLNKSGERGYLPFPELGSRKDFILSSLRMMLAVSFS